MLAMSWYGITHQQTYATNLPPSVSIVWPPSTGFGLGSVLKLKARAADADGFVTQVQFFADMNLIGVVTNPPFNVVWLPSADCAGGICIYHLKAVAVDNRGATAESPPVRIGISDTRPIFTFLEIVSPRDGAIYPAPATFTFSAEFLATDGRVGPVEFYVGTNLVGVAGEPGLLNATSPPTSITVTNLPEGEYELSVRYPYDSACRCLAHSNTVRVVAAHLREPRLLPAGQFQCEVLTSYPGRPNIIEASLNLQDWTSISTNYPATNTFTFTDSSPQCDAQRFYRVRVPPP